MYQVISNVHGNRQLLDSLKHLPNAVDLAMRSAEQTPFGVAFEVVGNPSGMLYGVARRPRKGEGPVWREDRDYTRREVL